MTAALELEVLTALAEPNRKRIVELLRDGPRSVGDIADRLQLVQPQTSRHLRVLADAGLVRAERQAQSRIYHLHPAPFRSLTAWLDSFAQVWETRTDRLDGYLTELQSRTEESE
ncbi:ArsR/SmtB family transcription factor [Promicromonospora sukumoe]|uniref:ArsR/SmtB family transcription factor n=1 Tax=Promicromonospora sukumoe TaxID=88382 RepID=UPI00037A71AE|nr:metalloregulator ArsR/SmtB family transcription factor [Promicromonospora sukumoe]